MAISCHVLSIGLLKSGVFILYENAKTVDAVLVLMSFYYKAFGGTCQVKISGYKAVLWGVLSI